MGTFGENMQREREMRGISLQEIALSTKIGVRSLQALEEEDFEKLPGGIFNKGFVRAYARYLGIDEEQAVADFQAARTEKMPAPFGQTLQKVYQTQPPKESHSGKIVAIVLVLLALAGLGYLGWRMKWLEKMHITSSAAETTAVPESTAPAPANDPAGPVSTNPGSTNPNSAAGTGSPPANSTAPMTAASSSVAGPPSAQASSQAFLVEVKASERVWVSISADGKRVLEGVLKDGDQKSFNATDRVVINTGNAGGLQISRNGEYLPAQASDKHNKSIVITRDAVQSDTSTR